MHGNLPYFLNFFQPRLMTICIPKKRQKTKCQNNRLLNRFYLDLWFVIIIMQMKLSHTYKCCSRYNFTSTRRSDDESHISIVICHDDRWHGCQRAFPCMDIICSSQWGIGYVDLNAWAEVYHLVVINNPCISGAIAGTEPESWKSKKLVHFV